MWGHERVVEGGVTGSDNGVEGEGSLSWGSGWVIKEGRGVGKRSRNSGRMGGSLFSAGGGWVVGEGVGVGLLVFESCFFL